MNVIFFPKLIYAELYKNLLQSHLRQSTGGSSKIEVASLRVDTNTTE